MVKRQKDRQHNGQKTEGQTTQWSKDRKIDNTMVKRKGKKDAMVTEPLNKGKKCLLKHLFNIYLLIWKNN
jgi:hypothetical protein